VNLRACHMDASMWEWFNDNLPILSVEDTEGIIAVDTDTGENVGGCVMDNWTDNSVQAHFLMSSPMVFRNKFFHICASYIFEERKKEVVFVTIKSDNLKSIKFCTHVGFIEQCRLKDAFNEGVDCVIMELRKDNCMYLLDEVA
jgi:RimJ/RimL family protein N-acetyltransferase